jgi:hypothetical protein
LGNTYVSAPAGKCAHKPGQTHRSAPTLLQLILKDRKRTVKLRPSLRGEEYEHIASLGEMVGRSPL